MRARALFAVTVGVLLLAVLAVATPAAAKTMIAKAHIGGPELRGGGLRISAPATEGMWDSGISVADGLGLALAGLVALSVAAPRLRRRVLAVARAHR